MRAVVITILAIMTASTPAGPAATGDRFAAGLEQFNAGQWEAAAGNLVAAAAGMPNDVVARLTAGVAMANLKRYPEAVSQFKAASRLAPGGPLPQFLLDGTYSEMGNVQAARHARSEANRTLGATLQKATANSIGSSERTLLASLLRYPQNAIARCLLGDLYQLWGRMPEAKTEYTRASELAPGWAKPVFNLGLANLKSDPASAEEAFGRAIKIDPSNSRAYLWQGDALLKQGKPGMAIEAYQNASRDRSLTAEARTRIGNAQLQVGDYDSAAVQFDMAQQQAPQDPRPLVGQAEVYRNAGKLKEAEDKLGQAAQVQAMNNSPAPAKAFVTNQIAEVQIAQGKFVDAVSSFGDSFAVHPTLTNAYQLALAQKQAGKLEQAIKEKEAVRGKGPGSVPALIYLLSAYRLTGNAAGQLDAAQRLVKLDPANAPAYHAEAGGAMVQLGRENEAIDAYTRAFDAGNSLAWFDTARRASQSGAAAPLAERYAAQFRKRPNTNTARILFELQSVTGDVVGMRTTATWLTKHCPEDPSSWLRLGEASEKAGDLATAAYAYSLAAASSSPEAAKLAKSRLAAIKAGAPAGTRP